MSTVIDIVVWGVMLIFVAGLVIGFNRQMMERHAKRDEAIKRHKAHCTASDSANAPTSDKTEP